MLNGRVYGRRRPYNKASTDPFANVRDTEPEFVEWGYGGMGSNKSNTNSSMGSAWRAVQNRSNASAFGNDEDDASGMAWVKKRRAARERSKLEAEKPETQADDSKVERSQPAAVIEEEMEGTPRLPEEGEILPAPVETPTVDSVEQSHENEGHVTTAINLPPHRAHKREPPSHRTQIPQVESPTKEKAFGVDVFDIDLTERPEVIPEISQPSADSTSEEEEEEEEDSSIGGDDEDDSDAYSEVRVQAFRCIFSPIELASWCRRMHTARRPWGQVSRK